MVRLTQIACLLIFSTATSPLFAQAVVPRPTPPTNNRFRVALLDVTVALRENARFQAAMEGLKADIDEFEDEIKLEKKKLDRRAEAVKKLPRGKRRTEQEQEITKAFAEQHIKIELKKQAWLALETQIYFEAYMDLRRRVEQFAKKHRIDLVVRHDRTEVQANDRQSVLNACNRAAIYHNNLDITDSIVEMLNRDVQVGYGLPPVTRGQIPKPPAWMTTIPVIAVQQVLTARAAWTVDRLVFPPSS